MFKSMTSPLVLKCPACSKALENPTCNDCGNELALQDGIPIFPFATGQETYTTRVITFAEVQATLTSCFQLAGQGQTGTTHHLDGTHAAVFESQRKGATVLEIGCGGGQMRPYITTLGLDYMGTDVSRTNVSEDLQRLDGPDFLSDVHNLPVLDAAVDVVYSAAVTQYFSAPTRAFQEVFRVLKPGGYFLSNCAFIEPWTDGSFFHTTPNGAISLLLSAGFEVSAMWPSRNYTGYQSLLASGSKTARSLRFLGTPMRLICELPYAAKRILRRGTYDDHAYAVDLARTAGGIDWIAKKPKD